jgi:stringent starvation protein B
MSAEPPQLPPKPDVALALLQSASSVFIHLDPRGDNVLVPPWFKKQPQLVLQVGLNMTVAIPDLDVGNEGISCTLSFNRSPEFCKIPWDAIYGLVGDDGRGMIWPDSVPSEVAASADGRSPVAQAAKARRPKLRLASAETATLPETAALSETAAPSEPADVDETPSGSGSADQPSVLAFEDPTRVDPGPTEARTEAAPKVPLEPAAAPATLSAKGAENRSDRRKTPSVRPPEGAGAKSKGSAESGGRRELPPYLRVVK